MGLFVPMTVMQIWIVRMFVSHRFVFMPMRVRFSYRPLVTMLMMFIMDMTVLVRQCFVKVFVFMPFRQMEP